MAGGLIGFLNKNTNVYKNTGVWKLQEAYNGLSEGSWPLNVPFAFMGGYTSTSVATTQQFFNINFGAEHDRRRIFVAVHWTGTTGTPVVTIGGITAFQTSGKDGAASTSSSYFFIADVPTGNVGAISISGIGTPLYGVGILVFSGIVDTTIPTSSAEVGSYTLLSSTTSGTAVSRATVAGGFAYAVLAHGTGGSGVTVSSADPAGATISYTIPLTYPFYGVLAYPTTGANTTITYSWSGSPTNAIATWAFNL
jgi:hypothetical protein